MTDSSTSAFMRQAVVGDKGIVIGATQEPGSGMATLEIELPDGGIVLIDGDWRMIRQIQEDLTGFEIEVVDCDFQLTVRPVDPDFLRQ